MAEDLARRRKGVTCDHLYLISLPVMYVFAFIFSLVVTHLGERVCAIHPVRLTSQSQSLKERRSSSTATPHVHYMLNKHYRAIAMRMFNGFECSCSACSLPPDLLAKSDSRRQLLNVINNALEDLQLVGTSICNYVGTLDAKQAERPAVLPECLLPGHGIRSRRRISSPSGWIAGCQRQLEHRGGKTRSLMLQRISFTARR